jgi:hypothetical protein
MSFQNQAGTARVHGQERVSAAQMLYHTLLSSIVQTLKPADVLAQASICLSAASGLCGQLNPFKRFVKGAAMCA